MSTTSTSSKHPQPIHWQLVMGVEYCANGSNPETILSRLCKGFDPMEAGR